MKSVVALLFLLSSGVCGHHVYEHKAVQHKSTEDHKILKEMVRELHRIKATVKDLACMAEGLGCPGQPETEGTDCVRDLFKGIDFPGSDFRQVLSPSVEHCQLACTQNSLCQFFTYLEPTWTADIRQYYCYLKRTPTGQPIVRTNRQHIISGYSLRHCKD
ncbi:coagulation factor XI [Esox lucius]|uniref:coagulation factor XI n=1 Tax=Esox lucius TaxID=8010 RepID=UPI0014776588|nr:coagulation factor XI [Esox lucius]